MHLLCTPAEAKAWLERSVGSVTLCVRLSVFPRSKWKTARIINTKIGSNILNSKPSASVGNQVKRSKVKVTELSSVLPAWVCRSIRLHIFTARRYAGAVLAVVCPSVCHTPRYRVKPAKRKVVLLLPAFSVATSRICGASRGPSASAELLLSTVSAAKSAVDELSLPCRAGCSD